MRVATFNANNRRGDHYRIFDEDVWGMIVLRPLPALQVYEDAAAEGAKLLIPGPGARRMRETQAFYAFLRAEQPKFIERWRQHRRAMRELLDGEERRRPGQRRDRAASSGVAADIAGPHPWRPTPRRGRERTGAFAVASLRQPATLPAGTP